MFFEQLGYATRQDVKGRYLAGMLSMLNPPHELNFLRETAYVTLFSNAQIRKGRAFTYAQLHQIANPGVGSSSFYEQFDWMVERGIFKRGYRLECSLCGLDYFYSLQHIADDLSCDGCLTSLAIPLEQPIAYQLNPLWMEAMKNGALTSLRTLRHFWHDDIQWEAELSLQKAGHSFDVDLMLQRDDGLFVIECKDNFRVDAASIDTLQSQLTRLSELAQVVDAHCVFATLYDEPLPESLQAFLRHKSIQRLTPGDF